MAISSERTSGRTCSLVHQGFDAPIESTKHIAEEAIRGDIIAFCLKDQDKAIREQNLPLSARLQRSLSVVGISLPCHRWMKNIMLMGISMGGGSLPGRQPLSPG